MKIYHLNKNYKKLTIWCGDKNGQRICVLTRTPIKGLGKKERYEELIRLIESEGRTPPPYND
jgi:hypothetical protein